MSPAGRKKTGGSGGGGGGGDGGGKRNKRTRKQQNEVKDLDGRLRGLSLEEASSVFNFGSGEEMTTTVSAVIRLALEEEEQKKMTNKCSGSAEKWSHLIESFINQTEGMDFDGMKVLMENKDFLPLLKKWLNGKQYPQKLKGLGLISCLLGSSKIASHLEKFKPAGLVSSLINLMTCSNNDVCEKTMKILENLILNDFLVKELISSSGFFLGLTKLANRDHPATLAENAVAIIYALGTRHARLSVANVKSLLPTIRCLMNIKNTDILALSVTSIGMLCLVDGAFEILHRGGVLLSAVALLSNESCKKIYVQVAVAISSFVSNPERALALLKLLRGTTHLKELYRLWFESTRDTAWNNLTSKFFRIILELVEEYPTSSNTTFQAIMNCGLGYSLVQCLSKEGPLEQRRAACFAIGSMCCRDISVDVKRALVDAGILKLSVGLLESTDVLCMTRGCCIIGKLVESKVKYRDELISLGAVWSLTSLIRKQRKDLKVVKPAVLAFKKFLTVTPRAPLSAYQSLPMAFKKLVDEFAPQFETDENLAVLIMLVLNEFVLHGKPAIDMLMEAHVLDKLLPFISSESELIREASCNLLLMILHGATKEIKQGVLDSDLFNHLGLLFSDEAPASRQMAIKILRNFFDKELSFTDEHMELVREKIIPHMLREMSKDNPTTKQQTFEAFLLLTQLLRMEDQVVIGEQRAIE